MQLGIVQIVIKRTHSKGVKNKLLFHNICKLYYVVLESHETAIHQVKHSSRYAMVRGDMEREEPQTK